MYNIDEPFGETAFKNRKGLCGGSGYETKNGVPQDAGKSGICSKTCCREGCDMLRRLGFMAAGVAVGLVVTGVLLEQERQKEEELGRRQHGTPNKKEKGLFAEVDGNIVRLYEVKEGRFCGYTETKVFDDPSQAMEWVVRETDAKIVIAGQEAQE